MPLAEHFKEISILQVAEKLGIVVKRNFSQCFMHDDKTPSLSFNEKRGLYYCHGCGKGGDVIALVQEHENLNFGEAKNWLYDCFLGGRPQALPPPLKSRPQTISIISSAKPDSDVYEWIFSRLTLSDHGKAYLKSRRIESDTIERFGVRDLPDPNELFVDMIKTWGKDRLMKCGIYREDDPNKPVNWLGHVLLFPFYNHDNRIVYIQGRRLEDNGRNKYVNLHSLVKPAYNLNCITQMEPEEPLFFCEGIFDVLTMSQLGHNCIGILGSSGFTSEMVRDFLRFEINVVPDNDESGTKFFESIRKEFLSVGKVVRKRVVPAGFNDLNESYVKRNS
jgi:DNA primase